ncbi:MAG: toxin-antitoxin system HicB family antitoxin, partial [Sphingomonas sp.]
MRSNITSAKTPTTNRGRAQPAASGTFVLRLDPRMHAVLRGDAAAAGTSLNDWCGRVLAAPGGGGLEPAAHVVLALRARLGDDLVGVVAYGSFTR